MSSVDDFLRRLTVARRQAQTGERTVLDELVRNSALPMGELAQALREQAGVTALVGGVEVGLRPEWSGLDRQLARNLRCVPLKDEAGSWWLAAADPWDLAVVKRACRAMGVQPTVAAVSAASLQAWLGTDSGGRQDEAVAATPPSGPVVAFVDQALRGAYGFGASDVHFETDRQGVTAKFRLDGVLTPHGRLEGIDRAAEVISRIKVLSQLDITERRLPQDGRCRLPLGQDAVDVRVSIMPSIHGEDAVLRLLDRSRLNSTQERLTLEALGFRQPALGLIRDLASVPSGMLLVTGPTGSGKTTTVYAALSELSNSQEKVITIEDPVEYELAGVLQIPVNERKGLTFARGLRSVLRHDPDRILVGEIRDAETAEIAVQSALTGHQVMTTVHANSLADVVGRFRHFGLDMFGFMSSLNGVVVQRLIRQLCPSCAGSREPSSAERQWLARWHGSSVRSVPTPIGCGACRQTGYRGRFVVAEVHRVDDELRDRVTEGVSMGAIRAHAQHSGIERLESQCARHVLEGRSSLDEVRRVVGWT